ncbi:HD domain-containing phosphohydrolase [Desulfosarcina sp.]|uniref:HD domain-containing phosphohydrolase n=1 Tax=Desulfosarcina sp. TaxID=2027861 RepID=UPI003970605E
MNIEEVLDHAGMKPYEIADQGHWFTQVQIDRFYEKVAQLTGNTNIAREAGRFAASPSLVPALGHFIFGQLGPGKVYQIIGHASENYARSSNYQTKKISANKVEITVTPKPGVNEKPYQCENRMGLLEAIAIGFTNKLPRIEHTQCIFTGAETCKYLISWEISSSEIFRIIQNYLTLFLIFSCIVLAFFKPEETVSFYFPLFLIIFLFLGCTHLLFQQRELKKSLNILSDSADRLMDETQINYNNTLLTNEIGQTISKFTNIKDVMETVASLFEKRLDYDRGFILLVNEDRSLLEFRAGFGYDQEKLDFIKKSAFHLNKADSKGVFVVSFREQKPFLINDIEEISPNLSKRSLAFAHQMGTQSFICCPIICDGKSIGILAVDNLRSKRPLVQSDLSLLMGIASVIGISINNADLLEARQRQFGSILHVLAASIDARDPLTAGHSEKVTEFALGICDELNLSTNYREMIRVASLLHDYGKIGVPDSILKKPGRLTKDEYEKVKTHAQKTQTILEQINFEGIFSQVPEIAGSHHEKMDGSGYPNGLKGDEIPLGAKIIAVADFFEAVTAKRHYRDPLPINYALRLLEKGRGIHFDEKVVDAFTRHYEKELLETQFLEEENMIRMQRVS